MHCFTVRLQEQFAFLEGSKAVLDAYLHYNMTEMHREHQRRPSILICPGGGYAFTSDREAEPIALRFLDRQDAALAPDAKRCPALLQPFFCLHQAVSRWNGGAEALRAERQCCALPDGLHLPGQAVQQKFHDRQPSFKRHGAQRRFLRAKLAAQDRFQRQLRSVSGKQRVIRGKGSGDIRNMEILLHLQLRTGKAE